VKLHALVFGDGNACRFARGISPSEAFLPPTVATSPAPISSNQRM
jgi:hypothetical protein